MFDQLCAKYMPPPTTAGFSWSAFKGGQHHLMGKVGSASASKCGSVAEGLHQKETSLNEDLNKASDRLKNFKMGERKNSQASIADSQLSSQCSGHDSSDEHDEHRYHNMHDDHGEVGGSDCNETDQNDSLRCRTLSSEEGMMLAANKSSDSSNNSGSQLIDQDRLASIESKHSSHSEASGSYHSSGVVAIGQDAQEFNFARQFAKQNYPTYVDYQEVAEGTDILINELNRLRLEKVKWDMEKAKLRRKVNTLQGSSGNVGLQVVV